MKLKNNFSLRVAILAVQFLAITFVASADQASLVESGKQVSASEGVNSSAKGILSKATNSMAISDESKQSAFNIKERGPHHRVWERVKTETAPDGRKMSRKVQYTELSTGMHFKNDKGEWEESDTRIEILPKDGGAYAGKGQHKVIFPVEIKSGIIELQTPEGKWLRSRVWGLAYFDSSNGKSVLLAEIKESEGQVQGDNVVVYPDAFTDFAADVRYTYMRAGFEQDVVLREQPPSPEKFGLNPKTTRLQVLTEFIEAPRPETKEFSVGELADQSLGFGAMKIGSGKAFSVDAEGVAKEHVPVAKQWGQVEGRTFLVEEARYEKISSGLDKLPEAKPYKGAGLIKRGEGKSVLAGLKSHMPERYAKAESKNRSSEKLMARISHQNTPSFVMDYQMMSSATNFMFRGDTTYFITNAVILDGETTFEGGAVIKYATNASITLTHDANQNATILKTAPYRPVIFTSKDDNSVGETISGSTGNPTNRLANPALGFFGATGGLDNFRFLHAQTAVKIYSDMYWYQIKNLQIIDCDIAFDLQYGFMELQNALLSKIKDFCFQGGDSSLNLQNVTVDQCGTLASMYPDTIGGVTYEMYNSLFVNVTNWGNISFNTNQCVMTNGGGIFQTVGAGKYYLATNSPFRNVGATNVLAELLKNKTTYPPVYLTNTITQNTTLSPQAQRDTDVPDLGYHYDPIDYLVSCKVSNSTITLTNGVAIGYYDYTAIWLWDNAHLSSFGTPLVRNYLTYYSTVQEQPIRLHSYGHEYAMPFSSYHTNVMIHPEISLRFTTLAAPQGAYWTFNGGGSPIIEVQRLEFLDCEIFGGGAGLQFWGAASNASYKFINNLFDNTYIWMDTTTDSSATMVARNNLFRHAFWGIEIANWDSGVWEIKDNVFDRSDYYIDGDMGNNAYLNGSFGYSATQTNDLVLTNFSWVAGPLGDAYQSTNSTLINAGSVTNAALVGLYHYTTTTNQVRELNSIVDIGYHYVAVNSSGNSIDTDGDGFSDYLEDTNGNGLSETNETSFTDYYNGVLPTILILSGDYQIGSPSSVLPSSLKVLITDTNNNILANAPLTFSVTAGGGLFGLVAEGATNSALQFVTDSNGQANVFLKLPATSGVTVTVEVVAQSDTNEVSVSFTELSGVTSMAVAGDERVVQLLPTGKVVGWGTNNYGQLGDFTHLNSDSPVSVVGLTNITIIASGHDHSFAVDSNKNLWAWGRNQFGQLGNGTTNNWNVPSLVAGMTNCVEAVAGGTNHSVAVKTDGTVWQWGDLGEVDPALSPIIVSDLTNIVSVSAGVGFSLALSGDGKVWSRGVNTNGQLGNGKYDSTNTPVQVSGLTNIIAISSGNEHSLALDSNGNVWGWGYNYNGQAGLAFAIQSANEPGLIEDLTNVVGIAAGGYHSMAVDSSGRVWTWGQNLVGQLGNGGGGTTAIPSSSINSRTCKLEPSHPYGVASMWVAGKICEGCPTIYLLETISNIVQISASDNTSIALDIFGNVWTWGDGNFWPISTDRYVDFYAGQLPELQIYSGNNQTTYGSLEFATILAVRLTDTNGIPLTNAPVSVEVIQGDMQLRTETGRDDHKGLRLESGTNGVVSFIGYADRNVSISNCIVKILAASQEKIVRVDFSETLIPPVGFPTVEITSSDTFSTTPGLHTNITITVNAQDTNGSIQRVEYNIYDSGGTTLVFQGSSTNSPFSFTATNISLGEYLVEAVAKDDIGLSSDPAIQIIHVLLDTDGDLIPDNWEIANGLNATNSIDAGFDPDGDGLTNLQEYQERKNPNDYYNGVLPRLTFFSGTNQAGLPNSFLGMPLYVRVTDTNDVPLTNAPIFFTSTSASVQFALATNVAPQAGVAARTVSDGLAMAWIFFKTNAVNPAGVVVQAWSATNYLQIKTSFRFTYDSDLDGLSDEVEIQIGTSPILVDTDGDGVPDNLDAFPLDPTRSTTPSGSDTTPPTILLDEPENATL